MMIEKARILVSFLICLLGLVLYEYFKESTSEVEDFSSKNIVNVLVTLLSIVAVLLYIIALRVRGNY